MKESKIAGLIILTISSFTFLLVFDKWSQYWQYADELGVAFLVSVAVATLNENNNKNNSI